MQARINKRGWFTFAVVLIAVTGYFVYKYAYLIYQDYDYYTYYDDIHSLQIANPVYVNGVKVGEVSRIELNGSEQVRVTLSIDKETRLTKGTTAILGSNNLRGDKMVFLELGKSTQVLTHKSIITGKYDTTVMDMSDQINPIIESTKYILKTADKNFSTFNRKVENGMVGKTQKDIRRIEQSMNHYQNQLANIEVNAANVVKSIRDIKAQTQNTLNQQGDLNKTIKNTEIATAEWSKLPVEANIDTLNKSIKLARQQVSEIENDQTLRAALESKEAYNDASKKSGELNNTLREMKKD